jgi:hypothetical protein
VFECPDRSVVLVWRRIEPGPCRDTCLRARRELSHRPRAAADRLRDLAERHVEDVMEHERRALRGRELLEHASSA